MYLETVRHRNSRGRVYLHHLVTGGKYGRRKYVSRAALPAVKAEVTADRSRRKFLSGLRSAVRHAKPGPVPAINETQRIMLERCGYRLHGGMRVTRDRKRFFGTDALQFRHSMLGEAAKKIARTPEDLEKIEKKAISLQTAFASSGAKSMTYDRCLAAVFNSLAGAAQVADAGVSKPSVAIHSADSPC